MWFWKRLRSPSIFILIFFRSKQDVKQQVERIKTRQFGAGCAVTDNIISHRLTEIAIAQLVIKKPKLNTQIKNTRYVIEVRNNTAKHLKTTT